MHVTALLGEAQVHGIYDKQRHSLDIAENEYSRYSSKKLVLYNDLQFACNDPDVDALFICTPNFTHLDVLKVAMESKGANQGFAKVIDVAAGDKIPRKGGPGITRSDLLVINKIDLAPQVGADLGVMEQDTRRMRRERPWCFTNLHSGEGLEQVVEFLLQQLPN